MILRTKAEHVKVAKSSQSTRPRRAYARGPSPRLASSRQPAWPATSLGAHFKPARQVDGVADDGEAVADPAKHVGLGPAKVTPCGA